MNSNIIPTISVFCPCTEPLDSIADPPSTLSSKYTLHPLYSLNFCSECNQIKCRRCIEQEIVSKFCGQCMQEMKMEYTSCSRNCVNCPICESLLKISVEKQNEEEQKKLLCYNFKCNQCQWEYRLNHEGKSRISLNKIIKLQTQQNDLDFKFFADLSKFYISQKKNNQQFNNHNDYNDEYKLYYKEYTLQNLDQNIKFEEFLESKIVKPLDLNKDKDQLQIRINSTHENSKLLPIANKLSTKYSKRCKSCRSTIMKPDSVINSTKFYRLGNAIDYLPTVKFFERDNNQQMLLFKNPLNKSIDIKLSFEKSNEISTLSNFTIPGKNLEDKSIKSLVKQLSTVELTSNTRTSRIELMNRKPLNSINNNHEKNGLDQDQDLSILELGNGFILIPLKINNHEAKRFSFFISMKAKDFEFGYWSVLCI
ncbi:hypothetical protein WICMUC_000282 [Wickerhamomyces mucosus]|uniref:Dynactin subunit 4 n=1 Tax=Wickerhamomyces mucosus TaxID=1378264 RepID=A0A9P8TIX4_9ASCO|nr:hypothetical protein WICMUC_000282 [Wickerhamomyces mucosus]